MKDSMDGFSKRMEDAEKRISGLECRTTEI
jgi:hypothetical protein